MGLFDWLKHALKPVQPVEVNVSDLPHLARIAFAARCARTVQPLFVELWPVASPQALNFLEKAIATAERVAESGIVPRKISDVKILATRASGQAFQQGMEYASLVACVALHAVEAVSEDDEASRRACLEAYSDALDCIEHVRRPQLREQLEQDYVFLRQWLEQRASSSPIVVPKDVWSR